MNSFIKFLNRHRVGALLAFVALLVPVFGWAAAPISFTTPSVMKAGLGAIQTTITNLWVKGSYLARGQYICDSVNNPNCGMVYGVQGFEIPGYSKDTNSGSLAKYDLNRLLSPFSASTAASRGLKSGSGVLRWAIYNVIANPNGVKVDCSKVSAINTGTGGTPIFTDLSATGSINPFSTLTVFGPTEILKCGTLGTPGNGFSGTLLTGWTYSEVIN